MKNHFWLLLTISLIFLYSCKEKIVRYSDSGKEIEMAVGQVLKIELPGDAASGSDWRKMAYNDAVLIRKGKSNYMLSNSSSYPGVYYFRFTAINPGKSRIEMEYGSKYDDQKAPTRTFVLDVTVLPHP
jgi:predicted secreted protein